jgi:putative ABC transport system ATP-binding protein
MHDAGFSHRVINLFDGEVITENVNEPMVEIL